MQDVRGFIQKTTTIADLYRREQCQSLMRDMQLTGLDLDRAHPLFDQNRAFISGLFHLALEVSGLFAGQKIVNPDRSEIARFRPEGTIRRAFPEPRDFTDTTEDAPLCIAPQSSLTFIALLETVVLFRRLPLCVAAGRSIRG